LEGDARSASESESSAASIGSVALGLDVAVARAALDNRRRVVGARCREAEIDTSAASRNVVHLSTGVPARGAPESEVQTSVDRSEAVGDRNRGVRGRRVHVLGLEVDSAVLVAEVGILVTGGEEERCEAGGKLHVTTSEAGCRDIKFVGVDSTRADELGAGQVTIDQQGRIERTVGEEGAGLAGINGEVRTQGSTAHEVVLVVVESIQQEVFSRWQVLR